MRVASLPLLPLPTKEAPLSVCTGPYLSEHRPVATIAVSVRVRQIRFCRLIQRSCPVEPRAPDHNRNNKGNGNWGTTTQTDRQTQTETATTPTL
jgi:hypothetical protein